MLRCKYQIYLVKKNRDIISMNSNPFFYHMFALENFHDIKVPFKNEKDFSTNSMEFTELNSELCN